MGNFNCQKKTGKHMNDGANPKNKDKNCIFLKIAMEKCLLKSNLFV